MRVGAAAVALALPRSSPSAFARALSGTVACTSIHPNAASRPTDLYLLCPTTPLCNSIREPASNAVRSRCTTVSSTPYSSGTSATTRQTLRTSHRFSRRNPSARAVLCPGAAGLASGRATPFSHAHERVGQRRRRHVQRARYVFLLILFPLLSILLRFCF